MPKASKEAAPDAFAAVGYEGRSARLPGGYTVSFETYNADSDLREFFRGLPDDRCQSPHWGIVLRGRVTYHYQDREKTMEAGEAYYVPPGHTPVLHAGTEVIEFSPTEALEETFAVVADNLRTAGRGLAVDTTEVHRDRVTDLQLEALRRMAGLEPPVWIMGGYAEDALLAGTVTRAHEDIDWLFPRREYELRLAQAKRLGFPDFGVWGESAPGQPFYLSADQGELRLELGIVDEEDGALWMKLHKLRFTIDGSEPSAGYRVQLPNDTFQHPPVELDGIPVRPISALALYQLRLGIAGRGSFGPLTEKQLRSMRLLKERFFPDRTDEELKPRVVPLDEP